MDSMISYRARRFAVWAALFGALYFAAPWIVFDVRQPAYAFDEEYWHRLGLQQIHTIPTTYMLKDIASTASIGISCGELIMV